MDHWHHCWQLKPTQLACRLPLRPPLLLLPLLHSRSTATFAYNKITRLPSLQHAPYTAFRCLCGTQQQSAAALRSSAAPVNAQPPTHTHRLAPPPHAGPVLQQKHDDEEHHAHHSNCGQRGRVGTSAVVSGKTLWSGRVGPKTAVAWLGSTAEEQNSGGCAAGGWDTCQASFDLTAQPGNSKASTHRRCTPQ